MHGSARQWNSIHCQWKQQYCQRLFPGHFIMMQSVLWHFILRQYNDTIQCNCMAVQGNGIQFNANKNYRFCNSTANVYSQVIMIQWKYSVSDYEKYIIVGDDDVGIFQGGKRLLQVLDCQSLGGQVQVRRTFWCRFHLSHSNLATLQNPTKLSAKKKKKKNLLMTSSN